MSAAVDFLKSLFADKAMVDDREPIWTFSIPNQEGEYGLFAPKMTGWMQMVYLQAFHGIMHVIFAIIIYKLIIPNRGTTQAYLLGWGILIPLSAYLPLLFVQVLELQNRFVNLPVATIFTCVFFRCIQAMYVSPNPPYIEDNLQNYIQYYSSLSPFVWDDKTRTIRKPTLTEMGSLAAEVFFFFIASSLLLSYLMTADTYQPFESKVELNGLTITDPELYTLNHLLNAYLHTWCLYFTFKVGFEVTGLGENVKGMATMKVFNEPLLKSKSPTEFWTQRWNAMIHQLLKGGIFLPARQFFSTRVAIFITFLVSGLYHDYVWQVMFYDPLCVENCYKPIFGRVTAFFAYIGLIMLLERPVAKLPPIQWMSKNLPTFVIAQLLLLVHLPFVHWYGGDWMMGGFFEHFSIAIFRIRKI